MAVIDNQRITALLVEQLALFRSQHRDLRASIQKCRRLNTDLDPEVLSLLAAPFRSARRLNFLHPRSSQPTARATLGRLVETAG